MDDAIRDGHERRRLPPNAQKDRATEGTLRLDRSTVCAATAKPLKAPIVVCDLGYLLNKEDVIELMLSKALPPHLSHIKSLKGLHEATLHANPAHSSEAGHTQGRSEEDEEPPFYCPIATLPLNGRYPFVLIKPTGHVVSQRALKQVGGKVCPVTETKLSGDEAILQINPSEEERKEMQLQLEARKAAQAEAKKQKKQKEEEVVQSSSSSSRRRRRRRARKSSWLGSAADVGTYVYSGGDGEASAKAKGKEKAKASKRRSSLRWRRAAAQSEWWRRRRTRRPCRCGRWEEAGAQRMGAGDREAQGLE